MPPDVPPETFRRALSKFASGVTVVTTRRGDDVHGTTMSAFASVSLNPPLVLVSVDRSSEIHDLIGQSGIFAVNILHRGQADLAGLLSRKETAELAAAHRLDGIPYRSSETGAPVLDDHLAYVDCRVELTVPAGDHTIYIGRVAGAGTTNAEALLYYEGRFGEMGPAGQDDPRPPA